MLFLKKNSSFVFLHPHNKDKAASVVQVSYTTMGVGKGGVAPLAFENCSKKGYFLSFEWETTNFTTFGSPRKILEKSRSVPPGKTPSDAHAHKYKAASVMHVS